MIASRRERAEEAKGCTGATDVGRRDAKRIGRIGPVPREVRGALTDLARSAILYARRGVPVFPCEPDGGEPLLSGGAREAATDERAVRRWWRRWPRANVGIPTGGASGLVVLETGRGGVVALAELEFAYGHSKTVTATTGEGQQYYFRRPSEAELDAAGLGGSGTLEGRRELDHSLSLHADGSHVLAPPGRTLHGAHRWSDVVPSAGASWLIRCLRVAAEREAERERDLRAAAAWRAARGASAKAREVRSPWSPKISAEEA